MLQTSKIQQAGLYADKAPVPLKGISIAVEVLDAAAEVSVTQHFKNTESSPIEAVYCFPLEEGSAVYRFEAKIGDRIIKGAIEERDKAFAKYDEAIANGDGALLLDREKDDIFVASVGNLMPGQNAEISISYVTELPVSDDRIHLIIPATVSPRYIPEGYDPVQADILSPPTATNVPYRLSLSVKINNAGTVSEVSSPSHAIEIDQTDSFWSVTLKAGETSLDRDFILDISHKDPKAACAIVQEHENGDRAIMLRLYPEFDADEKNKPLEVIFLLDCSGSMQGSSIMQAKRVLEMCLRSMSHEDTFNIVRFGSTFEELFSESKEYTDVTFKKALSYIQKIDADMGGTELVPALRSALKEKQSAGRNIFLITDGEIGNEEEAIDLARSHRDTTRIFTFGIGYGASQSLVKGLSRVTGGMAEFVSPDESIEEKVLRQFSRFDSPCVADLKINWNGITVKQSPAFIPPIFSGDSFTVYGLIENGNPGDEVTLSGKINAHEFLLKAPVSEMGKGFMIPTLWAKNAVRDIETGSEKGSQQRGRKSRALRNRIVEISTRYQILSSETSFVAIETRTDTEKAIEAPVFRRVPIQLTKDWHDAPMFSLFDSCLMEDSPPYYNSKLNIKSSKANDFNKVQFSLTDLRNIRIKPEPPSSLLHDLLLTQTASGFFELTEKLAQFLRKSSSELMQLALTIEGIKNDSMKLSILATELIVLIFETKMSADKASWSKAVVKARKILNREAKDARLDGKPLKKRLEELFFI